MQYTSRYICQTRTICDKTYSYYFMRMGGVIFVTVDCAPAYMSFPKLKEDTYLNAVFNKLHILLATFRKDNTFSQKKQKKIKKNK